MPGAAGGLTERGEAKPGASTSTLPRPAELRTTVSGDSEKAAQSKIESGLSVPASPGADGATSSSTTRTGSLGTEESCRFGGDGVSSRSMETEERRHFGGDGVSSRLMGPSAAGRGRLCRGGDGENASRKSREEIPEDPRDRLQEGGEAMARPLSSSSRMSTTGTADAMGEAGFGDSPSRGEMGNFGFWILSGLAG